MEYFFENQSVFLRISLWKLVESIEKFLEKFIVKLYNKHMAYILKDSLFKILRGIYSKTWKKNEIMLEFLKHSMKIFLRLSHDKFLKEPLEKKILGKQSWMFWYIYGGILEPIYDKTSRVFLESRIGWISEDIPGRFSKENSRHILGGTITICEGFPKQISV